MEWTEIPALSFDPPAENPPLRKQTSDIRTGVDTMSVGSAMKDTQEREQQQNQTTARQQTKQDLMPSKNKVQGKGKGGSRGCRETGTRGSASTASQLEFMAGRRGAGKDKPEQQEQVRKARKERRKQTVTTTDNCRVKARWGTRAGLSQKSSSKKGATRAKTSCKRCWSNCENRAGAIRNCTSFNKTNRELRDLELDQEQGRDWTGLELGWV